MQASLSGFTQSVACLFVGLCLAFVCETWKEGRDLCVVYESGSGLRPYNSYRHPSFLISCFFLYFGDADRTIGEVHAWPFQVRSVFCFGRRMRVWRPTLLSPGRVDPAPWGERSETRTSTHSCRTVRSTACPFAIKLKISRKFCSIAKFIFLVNNVP